MAVYRVVIRGTVLGQAQQITRYWDSVGGVPNLQALADAVGQAFADNVENLLTTDTQFNDTYIGLAAVGSLGTAYVPDSFPFTGTNTGVSQMPPHDAVLLRYGGAILQYPRQNRNRISGIDENQVTNGQLSAAAQTTWLNVAMALSASYPLGLVTWSPVLWSDTYQTYQPVTTRNVSPVISTQRTRRIGAGA